MKNKLMAFFVALFLSNLSLSSLAAKTLFEYSPNNGYVLLNSKAVISDGIPERLTRNLKKMHKSVVDVAFSPDGKGWTIVTKHKNRTHGIRGDYKKALNKLQSSGTKIASVTFNPVNWKSDRGFVIIHNKGYVAKNIPASLKEKLDQFEGETGNINVVEFTPDGGWTVISGTQEWSRMVQGKQVGDDYIDSVRRDALAAKNILSVSFNPKNYATDFGWLIVTDEGYQGLNVPDDVRKSLEQLSIKNLGVGN